jgi:hypothetical protein
LRLRDPVKDLGGGARLQQTAAPCKLQRALLQTRRRLLSRRYAYGSSHPRSDLRCCRKTTCRAWFVAGSGTRFLLLVLLGKRQQCHCKQPRSEQSRTQRSTIKAAGIDTCSGQLPDMWDSTWIRLGAESSDMCRGSALGQLTSKALGRSQRHCLNMQKKKNRHDWDPRQGGRVGLSHLSRRTVVVE